MATKCQQCSAELPQGARFCPQCGQSAASVKTCPWCATATPADAKFCPACQANLSNPTYVVPASAWYGIKSGVSQGGLTDKVPPGLRASLVSIPFNPREDRLFFATDQKSEEVKIESFKIPGVADCPKGKCAVIATNARLIRWNLKDNVLIEVPYYRIAGFSRGEYFSLGKIDYVLRMTDGGLVSFTVTSAPSGYLTAMLFLGRRELEQRLEVAKDREGKDREIAGALNELFTVITAKLK